MALHVEHKPLVSVVMPVYNAAAYVAQAVKSILNQTYTHFELIIVDDGSTDSSCQIIEQFTDKRIKFIRFEQNQGIVAALNKGLALAQGKYIARMDADDISFEHRFDLQVKFLEAHDDVGVLGTQHQGLGKRARKLPLHHNDLCWFMMNASPFVHPSVMIRASVLKQHHIAYRKEFEYAEDLAMWMELSNKTTLANLKEVCIAYRYHFGTHQQQLKRAAELNDVLKQQMIHQLLPQLSHEVVTTLTGYLNQHKPHNYNQAWFEEYLSFCNDLVLNINQPDFTRVLQRNVWFHLASAAPVYPSLSSVLKKYTWIELSLGKKIWLVSKPYLQRIYK